MAISTTSSNYSGRSIDLSVLQHPVVGIPDEQIVVPGIGNMPRFCTGIQKLVQRYAIILLTNLGSQENYPEFGCDFINILQAGINPIDKIQAERIFSAASFSAVAALKDYQRRKTLPEDEKIASAELIDTVLGGGRVGFRVKIISQAGNSVEYVVPLPN